MKIKGRVALITGSASGIGREMAMILGEKGAKLVLWDLDGETLEKTAEDVRRETGAEVVAHQIDLTQRELVYEKAAEVLKTVGDVDILLNNAGIVSGGRFLDSPDVKNELSFKVNVLAHMWTIKSFLPTMLKNNRGHIVATVSLAGHFGIANQVDYAASKFACRGMMEALSAEIYGMKREGITGVRTFCLCPGPVETPLFKGFGKGGSGGQFVLSPQQVAQAGVDAIESDSEGQALMPWFLGKPGLIAKSVAMLFGGYGIIDDGSDPMGKMDYTQANRLHEMMLGGKGRGSEAPADVDAEIESRL